MKKALLWLLLLTVPFAFGCPSPRNDNGGNTNAGNIDAGNKNAGNTNAAPAILGDPKNKAILINVYEVEVDGKKERRVAVAPEIIKLSRGKGQKLRFHIFNSLEDEISSVSVKLLGEGEGFEGGDPADGGRVFKHGKIEPGTAGNADEDFRKPNQSIPPNTIRKYTYEIYIDGKKTEPKADKYLAPQIEIGG